MKKRSRVRTESGDICLITGGFEDYSFFYDWAISNNWTKGICVCRNGDVGNYEPSNTRLDTSKNNSIEYLAKTYYFTSPEGEPVEIYNLREFCRQNNLTFTSMYNVYIGYRYDKRTDTNNKLTQHKGWRKDTAR